MVNLISIVLLLFSTMAWSHNFCSYANVYHYYKIGRMEMIPAIREDIGTCHFYNFETDVVTYTPTHPNCHIVMKGDRSLTRGAVTEVEIDGTTVYLRDCTGELACSYNNGVTRTLLINVEGSNE